MKELKSCPFCGHPPSITVRFKPKEGNNITSCRIQCTNLKCGVTTYIQGYNKDHLITQWNQREEL